MYRGTFREFVFRSSRTIGDGPVEPLPPNPMMLTVGLTGTMETFGPRGPCRLGIPMQFPLCDGAAGNT